MIEGPRYSFNNLLVSIGAREDAYVRPEKGYDKLKTYVEAVNYLLKSCEANVNIAKAKLKRGKTMKLTNKFAVPFAEALQHRAARCGNAYPGTCIKKCPSTVYRLLFAVVSGCFKAVN